MVLLECLVQLEEEEPVSCSVTIIAAIAYSLNVTSDTWPINFCFGSLVHCSHALMCRVKGLKDFRTESFGNEYSLLE